MATVGKVRVEPEGQRRPESRDRVAGRAWSAERAVRATVAGVLDAAGGLGGAHEEGPGPDDTLRRRALRAG